MIIKHYTEVPAKPVVMEGAEDVTLREIITDREGAPTFAMRIFEVAAGGHTPFHDHDYEHEIFILEGEGEVTEGRQVYSLQPGSTALISPGTPHQFRNTGSSAFRFMCLIPIRQRCV